MCTLGCQWIYLKYCFLFCLFMLEKVALWPIIHIELSCLFELCFLGSFSRENLINYSVCCLFGVMLFADQPTINELLWFSCSKNLFNVFGILIKFIIIIEVMKSQFKLMWYYCWTVTYLHTSMYMRDRRGHDGMVVEFTTIYANSAYHLWCYEFESRSGRGVQHYVIKFVSDLRQIGGFLRVLLFPPPIKLTATI
jgi:hypothetical protein